MAKFEIGDVVIIRKPDSVEKRKESPVWVDNMDRTDGQKATILDITHAGYYTLDIDKQRFNYNEKWLEPIHSPKTILQNKEELLLLV